MGTLTVAVLLPPGDETVWLLPPLIVYVKVYGVVPLVPVNVISGEVAFRQIAVVPDIVAVGNGLIVTVALPLCAWLQIVLLPSLTLTSV